MSAEENARGTTVQLEERGAVLLITLDRPGVRNAVDGRMTIELGAAIEHLEESAHLGVGVITGAGDAFCAGLDMKAVAAGADIEATRHPLWGFAGMTSRNIGKPVVAAVNGAAIGGGLEIALACDIVVAADTARLGLPEVAHGVFAAGGGVLRLAQQLPRKVAVELLLTGRLFSAAEAHSRGLVNAVVPEGDVLDEAFRVAQQIADNAPLAVRATKQLIAAAGALEPTDPEAIAITDDMAARVFASLDASEGMAAFAEGRPPLFTGS